MRKETFPSMVILYFSDIPEVRHNVPKITKVQNLLVWKRPIQIGSSEVVELRYFSRNPVLARLTKQLLTKDLTNKY